MLFSQQLWKSASGLMRTALITVWLVSFWQHWCNKLFIFCMLNILSLLLPGFCSWCTKCKRQGLHLIKVICVHIIFSKHSDWNHISSLPQVSSETICVWFSNGSYFSSPTIYSKTCFLKQESQAVKQTQHPRAGITLKNIVTPLGWTTPLSFAMNHSILLRVQILQGTQGGKDVCSCTRSKGMGEFCH